MTFSFNNWIRKRRSSSGVTILELILILPVIIIFLLAVVEFGLILANLKFVPAASRAGAKVYAEFPAAALTNIATLTAVEDAINDSLAPANLTACRVILEHNVGGPGSIQNGTCACTPPAGPAMPVLAGGSVRVTVCVELSQFTPNLLGLFGFSTTGRVVQSTTTFPHEGP
jgi:Flp pilus assembly protein TadG